MKARPNVIFSIFLDAKICQGAWEDIFRLIYWRNATCFWATFHGMARNYNIIFWMARRTWDWDHVTRSLCCKITGYRWWSPPVMRPLTSIEDDWWWWSPNVGLQTSPRHSALVWMWFYNCEFFVIFFLRPTEDGFQQLLVSGMQEVHVRF